MQSLREALPKSKAKNLVTDDMKRAIRSAKSAVERRQTRYKHTKPHPNNPLYYYTSNNYYSLHNNNSEANKMKAVFTAGSAIRAKDLNNDFDQIKLAAQAARKLSKKS